MPETTTETTTTTTAEDKAPKLLNNSHCKQEALKWAKANGFDAERVSQEFFSELNAAVLDLIKTHLAAHPKVGKTVFGWDRRGVTIGEIISPAEDEAPAPTPEPEPAAA